MKRPPKIALQQGGQGKHAHGFIVAGETMGLFGKLPTGRGAPLGGCRGGVLEQTPPGTLHLPQKAQVRFTAPALGSLIIGGTADRTSHGSSSEAQKRGQAPFAGTARLVLRTNGA